MRASPEALLEARIRTTTPTRAGAIAPKEANLMHKSRKVNTKAKKSP